MEILIVEDNAITAKMIEHNLEKQGYKSQIAADGKAALEMMEANPDIQLVITDLVMPRMTGIELLRQIRTRPEWKNLPVIVVTSVKDRKSVKEAAELDCTDYLAKPLNIESLLLKIKKIDQKQRDVIQDPNRIRMRLHLTMDGYRELDAMFSTMILEKIALIEDHQQRGFPEDIVDSILELQEGAVLLGADQLKALLHLLVDKRSAKADKEIKDLYSRVLRVLRSLKEHLITKIQVTVRYELPEQSRVELHVENAKRMTVWQLVEEEKKAGVYEVNWNGCDNDGIRLPSGTYTIHLKAGSNVQERSFRLE